MEFLQNTWKVYGLHDNVHIWLYMKEAGLWINRSEYPNRQMKMFINEVKKICPTARMIIRH